MSAEARFVRQMIKHRKKRGWSQAELAARTTEHGFYIHPTGITKLEWAVKDSHKARHLRLDEAFAIAASFGLTLEAMLGDFCQTCMDHPPAGFTCQTCGASS